MLSPAQKHKERVMLSQALARHQQVTSGHSLHVQLRELERDIAVLRAQPRTCDRVEMKRTILLPKWLPTAQQYLDAGEIYQNLVFSWCVVWLFDVEEFDQGLDWADIAISQGQQTPDRLKRTFAAFVADTIFEWSATATELGESVEPYFSRTFKNVAEKWRLHEEISAKWYKAAGLLLLRDDAGAPRATAVDDVSTLKKADALLEKAAAFHRTIGVGTMRKQIAARIRALESGKAE